MDKTVLTGISPRGSGRPGWVPLALIPVLLLGAACSSVRDQYLFDKPFVEIVIVDGPFVASGTGGTVVTGTAQNQGTTTAEDLVAVVHIGGATYSAPVGQSYSDQDGVDNTVEPLETGNFRIEVPAGVGAVSASDITFTYKILEEEAA